MADVALLGTGRMGTAMVRRLAEAGHDVAVWNRHRETADALAGSTAATVGREAVTVHASPAEAVSRAPVTLSVLASGDVTTSVLLAPDVLSSYPPSAVVCDLATSGVAAARVLSSGFAPSGIRFVDAPVSGSVSTVAAGQLLVMAAGDPDVIDAVTPLLSAFAKAVVRVGDPGAGQAMKLAVNLVVHDLNAALSEALVLATRAGIPAEAAYDIFAGSAVAAPFVQYKRAAFLTDDAPVAMSLELVAKDLQLITGLAVDLAVEVPTTSTVSEQVAAACAAGLGKRDMADLRRFLDTALPPA